MQAVALCSSISLLICYYCPFFAGSLIIGRIAGYDSTTELETDHEKSVDADSRVTKHVKHKVCLSYYCNDALLVYFHARFHVLKTIEAYAVTKNEFAPRISPNFGHLQCRSLSNGV